jgi:sulfotransferase
MDIRIHFMSGLPQSGSTMLSGTLWQNPRFSRDDDERGGRHLFVNAECDQQQERGRGLYRSGTETRTAARSLGQLLSFHRRRQSGVRYEPLGFTKLPALTEHFPSAKVICCVRSISRIIDSVKRLIRRNAFELSGLFGFDAGGTVYTRVTASRRTTAWWGSRLARCGRPFFGEQADRLIAVSCSNRSSTLG